MKKSVSISLAVVLIIAVCCCFIFCASVPSGTLWNGYTILYVSKDFPETSVLSVLEQADIRNVITLSGQSVPIVSYMTPVQPDSFDPLSYVSRRALYFFDEAASFQLYYVPERYKNAVAGVVSSLLASNSQVRVGFDAAVSYPIAVPLLCLAAFLFFIAVSKHKLYTACTGVFFVLYVMSSPLYTSGAAVCSALYALFLFQPLWNRRGWLTAVLQNIYICVFLILSAVAAFSGSILSGILLVSAFAASASALFILQEIQLRILSRRRFNPVRVRPARCMPVINRHAVLSASIPVTAAAVCFVLFLSAGYVPSGNAGKQISLPAPAKEGGNAAFSAAGYEKTAGIIRTGASCLPGMTEYVTWAWNTLTFPYRSLNSYTENSSVIAADETILYPVYTRSEQGFISEQLTPVYVFNDAFIKTVIDGIVPESGEVEALLKQQNGFKMIEYRNGGIRNTAKKAQRILGGIFLVCSFAIPAAMASVFFWRKQK